MTVQVLRDPPLRHLLYIIGGRLRPNVGRSLLFLNLLKETCPRGHLRVRTKRYIWRQNWDRSSMSCGYSITHFTKHSEQT